ncbi:hypothetical protein GCM10012319_46300 [Comamonas sp. KCTC 72670]|nr:hypothetical protein GCM10012319_46300 [Comamonas sp. KCTC 72670]
MGADVEAKGGEGALHERELVLFVIHDEDADFRLRHGFPLQRADGSAESDDVASILQSSLRVAPRLREFP